MHANEKLQTQDSGYFWDGESWMKWGRGSQGLSTVICIFLIAKEKYKMELFWLVIAGAAESDGFIYNVILSDHILNWLPRFNSLSVDSFGYSR